MTSVDPVALLRRIAAGDKESFAVFYREFEGPIFRFVTSKLNDPFEAADILQEVFMEIWRSADKFEQRSTVRTWLFGIAYRKTMDRFRKQARVMLTDTVPEQEDESPTQLALVAAGEEAAGLRQCLEGLSPTQRLTVELAFFDDASYQEIAVITDAPEGTVKTRVFHAKKLLARCLAGLLGERAT